MEMENVLLQQTSSKNTLQNKVDLFKFLFYFNSLFIHKKLAKKI